MFEGRRNWQKNGYLIEWLVNNLENGHWKEDEKTWLKGKKTNDDQTIRINLEAHKKLWEK